MLFKKYACSLLLMCGLASSLGSGCASQDSATPTDASVADGQGHDALSMPDLGTYQDSSQRNVPSGTLGAPCDSTRIDSDCGTDLVCLPIGRNQKGICASMNCTLENPLTETIEDSCPDSTACARLVDGTRACLPVCDPAKSPNPVCGPLGLACSPSSIVYTGYVEVCAEPLCETNDECVATASSRKTPIVVNECDLKINSCFYREESAVAIGALCTVDSDCGSGRLCLQERQSKDGKTVREGGYCTMVGCKYGGNWKCPFGSRCLSLGSQNAVSACFATGCDPQKEPEKDGCRDDASLDQYECVPINGGDAVCLFGGKIEAVSF